MLKFAAARLVPFLATALFVSGCASKSRPPDGNGRPIVVATPVKEGAVGFFADQVEARVTLAPAGHPMANRPGGPRSESGGRPPGPPPGGQRGGEGRMASASGSPTGGRGGRSGEAMMPPAQITLSLTNRTQTPVEVEIAAFDSALGNFAVRPERLRLVPGEAASPDSMTTRLGVSSEDMPIKITLIRDGRRETQTVVIRNLTEVKTAP